MKWHVLVLAAFAGLLGNHAAQASGDFVCSSNWSLSSGVYDPCNNVPFLSPANDTRVNLRLLMADTGSVALPSLPLSDYDRANGYGLVPFPMENVWTPPEPANASADASSGDTSGSSDNSANDVASGDGSRCRSNNAATAQAFNSQVTNTSGLSDAERNALTANRLDMVNLCDGKPVAPISSLQSPQAKDFGLYLTGAGAFYNGDFATAQQSFTGLGNSGQAWLKETAFYMLPRTALNAAQVNAFDEYGMPKQENVDKTQLKTAEAGFKAYLQAYPQGLYAASARGLLRRVYWLMGDQGQLAQTYGDAMAAGLSNTDQATALVLEIDNKLLDSADATTVKDPVLLAVIDLVAMRQPDTSQQGSDVPAAKPLTAEMLQAQQPLFASHQELYAYLVAAQHFYMEKDPAKTLAALPDLPADKPITGYLAFSEAMLRGLALEATGDHASAAALWTRLFPLAKLTLTQPALQLAMAINLERSQKIDAVFTAGSLVDDTQIRSFLIRKSASPALLRQVIKDTTSTGEQKGTAQFVLLYKDLTRAHYQDYAGDVALAPLPAQPFVTDDIAYTYFGPKADLSIFAKPATAGIDDDAGYVCPTLDKVAARLQQNPKDSQGLLCLGEFIRSGFDFSPLDQAPGKDGLGSSDGFGGKLFSRLDGYATVINDPKAGHKDKAYALFRAVNCFAPSGNNGCDDQDISKDQRKKWFQALKTHYADTNWATKLQYYW
ncbi:MAG TPA: hypothetical protein VN229_23545 [Terriglobales bacterium]|nr:hypothetical protein [Terriglobales bacterium]